MSITSIPLNLQENSAYFPVSAKRTFQLALDDLKATKSEPFYAVQVNFQGTTAVKVCIKSGFGNNDINPVFASYSGQIIPVIGIGFVDSGNDAHGTGHTSSPVTSIIAFGGNAIGSNG